ncbi:DUF3389 family protein [Shewanella aestuarii]|uniref:DUF3389 family protein n=1 Tax=Shewanella aestuarii TaxID=1028752 RepID=A0A6G9QKP9_9GAMM|nr:DUF3389 family protein [Shewanella aestuarii]QIR14421.1 DUF3389 family protein [Shewanella aestuarii]
MVLEFSQGKFIITPNEVQCRIKQSSIVLSAAIEDISCFHSGFVIAADAATVKWSIRLDTAAQFEQLLQETGIQAL